MHSLTWHIVKKDFRHHSALLVSWWIVRVLLAIYPAIELAHTTDFQQNDFYPSSLTVGLVNCLLLIYIAYVIIKTDSPINDRAYWNTLPVSGGQMLAAKALFLMLFCGVVPFLISIAAKIGYGFPPSEWLAGQSRPLVEIVGVVTATTAMTTLFKRPLLAAVIFIVIYFPFSDFIADYLREHFYAQSSPKSLFLSLFILLLTGIIMVVFMYLRRQRKFGLALLAAGFTFAYVVLWAWTLLYPPPSNHPIVVPHSYVNRPDLSLREVEFSHLKVQGFTRPSNYTPLWGTLNGLKPTETNEAWLPLEVEANITWPGHPELDRFPAGEKNFFTSGSFPYEEVVLVAGLGNVINASYPSIIHKAPLSLTGEEFKVQLGKTPAHWEGAADFDVWRVERGAEVPLKERTTVLSRTSRIALSELQIEHAVVNLRINTLLIKSANGVAYPRDVNWNSTAPTFRNPDPSQRHFFVLWNPKLQETILSNDVFNPYFRTDNDETTTDVGNALMLVTDGIRPTFHFLHYGPDGATHDYSDAETRAWLADARVVELRMTPAHYYRVAATIDPLVLPTATPTEASAQK